MCHSTLDLVLVRHAATALNDAHRYQGHLDPPLTTDGKTRASALAGELAAALTDRAAESTLAAAGAVRSALLYTSDLRRARQTATLALPDIRAVVEPRLRELDFGEFDGATYAENVRRHGERFRDWLADPAGVRPPGGESLGDLETRLLDWLDEQPADRTVVAFTHGGPIRTLTAHARRVPFHDAAATPCAPGEWIHLSISLERRR